MTINRLALAATFAALAAPALAQDDRPVFYLLSHGGVADAFWRDWNAGAVAACERLQVECRISFANGDFAAQKEAFATAMAAGPAGIATTSAQPGLWTVEAPAAAAAGIPLVFFNTDDDSVERLAYVGADLRQVGADWATYLVENGHVEAGDHVFMPVEIPGASYQILESEGASSVFDPLGITYDVVEAGLDPAGIIAKMSEYMIANEGSYDAVIVMGDLVAAVVPQVMESLGKAPSSVPVVGWGNSREAAQAVIDGHMLAAHWQYPAHQGSMPVMLLWMASQGDPIGYDINTVALFEADQAQQFVDSFAQAPE
jgi:simple sugar transport system substrate-binding protein